MLVRAEQQQMEMYLLFPQGPLMAEVLKTVGKVWLVAGAFEAESGAEVDQCRLVHPFAVWQRIASFSNVLATKNEQETHITMC